MFAVGVVLQDPADGAAETKTMSSGRSSVTVTLAAWLGPLLRAVTT